MATKKVSDSSSSVIKNAADTIQLPLPAVLAPSSTSMTSSSSSSPSSSSSISQPQNASSNNKTDSQSRIWSRSSAFFSSRKSSRNNNHQQTQQQQQNHSQQQPKKQQKQLGHQREELLKRPEVPNFSLLRSNSGTSPSSLTSPIDAVEDPFYNAFKEWANEQTRGVIERDEPINKIKEKLGIRSLSPSSSSSPSSPSTPPPRRRPSNDSFSAVTERSISTSSPSSASSTSSSQQQQQQPSSRLTKHRFFAHRSMSAASFSSHPPIHHEHDNLDHSTLRPAASLETGLLASRTESTPQLSDRSTSDTSSVSGSVTSIQSTASVTSTEGSNLSSKSKRNLRLTLSKLRVPSMTTSVQTLPSPSSSTRTSSNSLSASYRSPSRRASNSANGGSTSDVKETNVMVRDYDVETGKKMINKYMIVKELGRGMHGKVKLCVDVETGEECVCIYYIH